MPGYNGFDVVDQVRSLPLKIIFTTAHRDYAIQAIRKEAFDYLLKPIDIDDLRKCIARISTSASAVAKNSGPLQISTKEGVIFIDRAEIIMLQASGSYTEIYLDNGTKVTASKMLGELEELLDTDLFFRCHRSFVINLAKIKKLLSTDGYSVEMKDGSRAEISKKSKDQLLEKMKIFIPPAAKK